MRLVAECESGARGSPAENNMSIDVWQAAATAMAAGVAVGVASRWWHLRRMNDLAQRLLKIDGAHQNTLRMSAQARKQVEDLQRLVAEYRRRLSAADLAGRRQAAVAARPAVGATASTSAAPIARPGGWADTQPL
jgi:nanoRNase/pAp phosphatase (c-di-AMP/oligoRNAs hydrolase)